MLEKYRKLRRVLAKPADERSLSEKLLISGALTSVEHGTRVIFRIGATLIVTRLLAPEIFGLFAIVITFNVILTLISDFGVRSLIITANAEKISDPEFLRTCWTVQLIRGLLLYGIVICFATGLFLLQHYVGIGGESVYSQAVLPAAIAATGLQLVFRGCESVNIHVFAKQMRLRRMTIVRIVQSIVSPCVTILVAFFHPTIWALVIATIVSSALRLFMTFRMFEGPGMRFCWRRDYRTELFSKGKWILGRSSLGVFTNEADRLLMSIFLPAWLFGLYHLAKQVLTIPRALVQKLHSAFGLQFFREIIDLPVGQIHQKYYKYRLPMDALTCLFAGLLFTGGPAIIKLMYDPRYLQAGDIVQIIAVGLPLIGLGMVREAFGAQQRFRVTALFGLVQTITIWSGMLLALAYFDSPELAFAVFALHRIPELALLLFYARREGWIDLLKEFRVFPLIGVGALIGWGISELIALVPA